jgi:rsbT antagonist protein RsbS
MDQSTASDRVPLQLIQGCLVASIQIDLTEQVLDRFRRDLLDRIAGTRVHGVVLDLSGVSVMDSTDFAMLRTTMTMASVMGADPIIVGLKPGIVSALMDMDVDTGDVRAALNLDHALTILGATAPSGATSELEPEADALRQQEADADGQ